MGPVRRPESFDEAADDYDAFRLPYPPEVVEAVVSAGRLGETSRVLEIGCGTGQLSVDLARRGCDLLALEMGSHLADHARRHLAPFPAARVEIGAFETWPLPDRRFDAVVAASSFHWLEPALRWTKAASALRPGGALVVVSVHHVQGGTPGFFEDAQPIYRRWGLSDDSGFQLPAPEEAPLTYPEVEALAELSDVERRRFEIPRTLSSASFVGWLRTDSLVATAEPGDRTGFLRDIGDLIDSKYGGEAARNWVYEVLIARRSA